MRFRINDFAKLFDKPLLSTLTVPYIILIFLDSSINPPKLLLIFLGLFLVDILLVKLNLNLKFNTFLVSSLLVFFYALIVFEDTQIRFHNLRFREFLLIFFLTTYVLTLFVKHIAGFKFFNLFMTLFGLTFFLNKESNRFFDRDKILEYDNFKFEAKFKKVKKSSDPVIFIIFDELSSSKEIFNFTNDSIDLFFDGKLRDNGFYVRNNFRSLSARTKFSMPSIFNFNLHRLSKKLDSIENINEEVTIQKSYYWIASNNLLVDSLKSKNVKSKSYGLFPFKNGIADDDFIHFWPSFFDPLRLFGLNTLISKFFQKTFFKAIESQFLEERTLESFRKNVFKGLNNLNPENNTFYYFHFYAPHSPYNWGDEYKSNISHNNEREIDKHIKFKRFFLEKITPLLLKKELLNSRIIITGDHGFRDDPDRANPYLTDLYLRGYDISQVKKINSVQDLGYLILESFK